MPSIDVKDTAGATVGSVELDEAVFGIEPNVAVMHQVVTAQLAARRSGTQSTKTRREVSGGGAKPYRQLVKQWGRILAREHLRGAHALSPDDPGGFARAVGACVEGRLEHCVDMVTTLAVSYADCVRQDYRTFLTWQDDTPS